MNMPGFTAETSLYKMSQFYRGTGSRPPGDTGPAVVAQLFCSTGCFLDLGFCAADCVAGGGICLPLCFLAFLRCQDQCGNGSGGGVGGQTPACPTGKKCCGQFIKHPGGFTECDGDCIPIGQKCVVDV